MDYYIRFGEWPADERSRVGESFLRSKAWLYTVIGEEQAEFEEGVSVYPAKWDAHKSRWVIPSYMSDSYMASLDELIFGERRRIFLVTGDEVDVGSDGEPLLKNVKLVKELQYSDIYNDSCYNEDIILQDEPGHGVVIRVNFLYKQPGKDPVVINDALTFKSIKHYLGGYFQMHRILPGEVVMLVLELDYPEQNTDANIFWPSLGLIYGPVIITALRPEEEIEEERKKLPWPWSDEYDYANGIPIPGEEHRSLSELETQKLQEFLGRVSRVE